MNLNNVDSKYNIYVSMVLIIAITSLVAASNENEQQCEVSRLEDDHCGYHTYKVVKPLLSYLKQLKEEVDKNDIKTAYKDREIQELQEKVILHGLNEAIIKELRDQVEFYKKSVVKDRGTQELPEKLIQHDLNEAVIKELRDQMELYKKAVDQLNNNVLSIQSKLNVLNQQHNCEQSEKEMPSKNADLIQIDCDANQIEQYKDQLEEQRKTMKQTDEEISKIRSKLTNCTEKLENCEKETHEVGCTSFGDSPGTRSETAGPGWTVIQQRINGNEDFNKNWDRYCMGFGSLDGDFFLGLERIHRLTKLQPHELYIHMEDFDGVIKYVRYDQFAIAGEDDQYKLITLSKATGNATYDNLENHINQKFSTHDRDNDSLDNHSCAGFPHRSGGWWYNACGHSNLNGKYYNSKVCSFDAIYWDSNVSLKTVKMMIRPKDNGN